MDASTSSPRQAAQGPETSAPARFLTRRRVSFGLAGLVAGGGAWSWHRSVSPARLPTVSYGLIDGQRLEPQALAGKPVMVQFWSTQCAPCMAEMPDLIALHETYAPQGLLLIAVAMPYDRPDHVLDVAARRKLPFAVALDPMGEVVRAWGDVEATPTAWLADRQGRLVQHWRGAPDFEQVRRAVAGVV